MSCGDDDEMTMGTSCSQDNLTAGVLIVNEGPFSNGTGSLTIQDDNLGLIQDAYTRNNCDSLAGSILQSATVIGDKIAVVSNLSNVVRILNANTMEEVGVISGLKLPRYIVGGAGNLAYVSQWGLDGVSGSVAEVDLSTFTVLREVATGSGPEELQLFDNMLYVPNSGGFGEDSTIVVINPADFTIAKTILTGINPQSLAFDVNNILWVLNVGAYDFVDPALNRPGSLVRITNDQVSSGIEDLDTGVSNLIYDDVERIFYWIQGANIASYKSSGNTLTLDAIPGFYYDLAQHPSTGIIYLCDAKDFNSQGEVLTYDPVTGAMGPSIAAGLIPSEVIFY